MLECKKWYFSMLHCVVLYFEMFVFYVVSVCAYREKM